MENSPTRQLTPIKEQSYVEDSTIPRKPVPSTTQERDKRRVPYWKPPALMIGTFFVGLAFALGHHFFYRFCNGREANQTLQQKWVTRAGTAFAFMVKTSLAISVGTAYVQRCWSSLQHTPQRIGGVDAMFDILENILSFTEFRIWGRIPLLTIPALVKWLLPLAAIVTPGTITINSTQQSTTSSKLVPQIQYNSSNFAVEGYGETLVYAGPKLSLSRIVTAAALQGQILQINAPRPNSSYTVTFFGPALKCRAEEHRSLTSLVSKNLINSGYPLTYLSWVPSTVNPNISTPPPPALNLVKVVDGSSDNTWESNTIDTVSEDAARIYVLALTSFSSIRYLFLDCSLNNASYTVEFDFQYPSQTVRVATVTHINNVPASTSIDFGTDATGTSHSDPLWYPRTSYQAVMDAFGSLLVGLVVEGPSGNNLLTGNAACVDCGVGSKVPNQPLLRMTKAAYWSAPDPSDPYDVTLSRAGALASTLEELFQNVTLSLLSADLFLKPAQQASDVDVTIMEYHNLYTYDPLDLWLAYGISIGCTLISVVLGMLALWENGLAYSNKFSSILRTTRAHDFDVLIAPGDMNGADPLPKHIAKQSVVLEDGKGRGSGFSLTAQVSKTSLSRAKVNRTAAEIEP